MDKWRIYEQNLEESSNVQLGQSKISVSYWKHVNKARF